MRVSVNDFHLDIGHLCPTRILRTSALRYGSLLSLAEL